MEREPNPPETYDRASWIDGDVVECWDCGEMTNDPVSWNGTERCLRCGADWAIYQLQEIRPLTKFEREFMVGTIRRYLDAVERGQA